jgi:signal transduction histidine kinase
MRFALALLLLLVPAAARCGIPVELRYFEDASGALRAEDIAARMESFPWKSAPRPVANFGMSSSRIWVRFRIPESLVSDRNSPLLLEVANANLERIGFFVVEDGRVRRSAWTGMGVPISARGPDVLRDGYPEFRISPPRASSAEYLISVEGRLPLAMPVEVMEVQEFSARHWVTTFSSGFFFGFLALAAIFNGFIAVSLRSRVYLYYSAFVATMSLMCAADGGLSVQFLWPENSWWALRELHVIGGLTLFFYGQFVRQFVASRRVAPALDRALLFLIFVSSVRSVLAVFWLTQPVIAAGVLAVAASNIVVLAIGIQALRRGVPSARYFLVSSVVFNVGYVLYVLQESNVLWLGSVVYHAPQIGIAFEICLLSLALADRIRNANLELSRQKAATVQAEKMNALGRMAGEIAHEVSNPLAIIHGNAVLIGRETKEPETREFAGKIEQTANRISKLVKGMRALSRDTRKDPFQPVSLDSILQDAQSLCWEKARHRGVSLDVPATCDVSLRCRGSEICQVLVNLLSNALDAVEGQPRAKIRVEVVPRGDSVEIAVLDTGPGVPAEIRAMVLDPFFTTKPPGKGLGLGLSISRTIVESHGGRLWLDENSRETRFAFTVPLSK